MQILTFWNSLGLTCPFEQHQQKINVHCWRGRLGEVSFLANSSSETEWKEMSPTFWLCYFTPVSSSSVCFFLGMLTWRQLPSTGLLAGALSPDAPMLQHTRASSEQLSKTLSPPGMRRRWNYDDNIVCRNLSNINAVCCSVRLCA